MQLPYNIVKLSSATFPSLYIWPRSLKWIVLTLAVIACFNAYVLLGGGLLGTAVLGLKMILGW